MFDKKFALKIKKDVDNKGLLLALEEKNHITGYTLLTYYYSNNIEKDKHIILMTNRGYSLEYEKNEGLYCNLMHCEDNVYIPMVVYKREI